MTAPSPPLHSGSWRRRASDAPATARRLERRKARIAARAINDRRRHARVALTLRGRMLHATRRECACMITDVSAGGLFVIAPFAPRLGSRVVVLIEGLGRFEGLVTRPLGFAFAMQFVNMTDRKRVRLADTLIWKINRSPLGLTEDRRAPRRGKTGEVRIAFSDGVATHAEYIDISDVGASFAAVERPRRGEAARIDERPAHVARLHERGFAVAFDPDETASPSTGENASNPGAETSDNQP